jgi:hypothetical protein
MTTEESRKNNLKEWDKMLNQLFNSHIPENYVWNNMNDIVEKLNIVSQDSNLTHLFFPDGGGFDLCGAGTSIEAGCIELYFEEGGQGASIIKPDCLIFQSFGEPFELAYFRLETKELEPSKVYPDRPGSDEKLDEELIEISSGEYADRYHWDDGYYLQKETGNKIPLPDTARLVTRHFSGSFVLFAKASPYRRNPEAYDGIHSKMSANSFREYIAGIISELKKEGLV